MIGWRKESRRKFVTKKENDVVLKDLVPLRTEVDEWEWFSRSETMLLTDVLDDSDAGCVTLRRRGEDGIVRYGRMFLKVQGEDGVVKDGIRAVDTQMEELISSVWKDGATEKDVNVKVISEPGNEAAVAVLEEEPPLSICPGTPEIIDEDIRMRGLRKRNGL